MKTVIKIKNLIKSYDDYKAVDNLSLSVEQGEFFGFLGPNGAGKTTTIRLLTGMIKPDSGFIEVAGFREDERTEISRLLGVIPESRGFYNWMTSVEYLSFFAGLYGVNKEEQKKKIDDLLKQVGLEKNKEKTIGAYSRGMKQRLGLARALISNPKILILDEPTLGLDPQGQVDIQNLLKKLNKQGITIFYSSHLLHEVSALCSKIAIINQGRLVGQGTLKELEKNTSGKNLTDVFINLTQQKYD